MQALELKVYEIFKTKLGEKEAATIIEYIETKAEKKAEEKAYSFKTDVGSLKDYMDMRFATKEEMSNLKTDILKQMYLTNVVQLLAIIGSVFAIIKFMLG